MKDLLEVRNCEAFETAELPELDIAEFRNVVVDKVKSGSRISAMFGMNDESSKRSICAVLANDEDGTLSLLKTDMPEVFASLTPICPQAHLFEREIAENFGVMPEGHPWLKPVRFLNSEKHISENKIQPAVCDFFKVEGDGVHEVAVGPVHAGVIEPGHFRFQCNGERVFHLEIALGFQHRGVEKAIVGGPNNRTINYFETLAGDTTIGHALAYAHAYESISGVHSQPRSQAIRAIALELERIANHAGDLGALAGDVGYLPTASYCGRLRGDFLNLQAQICGSRFGRGLVREGGVGFDIEPALAEKISRGLASSMRDLENAAQLLWDSPSVLQRFDDTGRISKELAEELGLVGPALRASGSERDVRSNFPVGIYRYFHLPVSTWHRGDVFARAFVRWLEAKKSAEFVEDQLQLLTEGSVTRAESHPLRPSRMVVSMIEGWRGEICHVAATDSDAKFSNYKIVDPSFHNWIGLSMALRNGQISDFPLINKSFNLSYCGHDL